MNKRFKGMAALAGFVVGTTAAHATFFGGVDAGALWESNFTGATGGITASSVLMGVYSGYVGAYKGFDKNRGAWVGLPDFAEFFHANASLAGLTGHQSSLFFVGSKRNGKHRTRRP